MSDLSTITILWSTYVPMAALLLWLAAERTKEFIHRHSAKPDLARAQAIAGRQRNAI
jgi:hypothetical protein